MTANTAKIRPKNGQYHAIPSNYAIARGLLPLYPTFSPFSPLPGQTAQTTATGKQTGYGGLDRVPGWGTPARIYGGLHVCVGSSLNVPSFFTELTGRTR